MPLAKNGLADYFGEAVYLVQLHDRGPTNYLVRTNVAASRRSSYERCCEFGNSTAFIATLAQTGRFSVLA